MQVQSSVMNNLSNIHHQVNITNVQFDKTIIYKQEEVNYFTDIPNIFPIPSNTIIYKTVTGIGATHGEVVAPRHSILVLPHIAIVKNKYRHYQEQFEGRYKTFPIYGDISLQQIKDYLNDCTGYAKFLTTPKGVLKLIKLLKTATFADGSPIPYKKLFFILIDECHKLIQDAEYRSDMLELMDCFFDFDKKAMVSATPIPPSNPRFIEHGFRHIKIKPQQLLKVPIELIHTNSLPNALSDYFKNNDAEHYCIFFNSLEGIKALISQLKLKDFQIFCSKKSTQSLWLNNNIKALSEFGTLKKYNFFTSSFFNGLDMHLPFKPKIVLLSDHGYQSHTILDPYTDVLQIVGRIRQHKEGEFAGQLPYHMVTHINNTRHFTHAITEQDAIKKIEGSKFAYQHIETLGQTVINDEVKPYFEQALQTVKPYAKLLTKEGKYSTYLKDNYLDDERVKTYYISASALRTAYINTQLYELDDKGWQVYGKGELTRLFKRSIRYSQKMNRLMADTLLELEDYKSLDIYHEECAEVERLSKVMFDAFNRLGYIKLVELSFRKPLIDKALLRLDIEKGLNNYALINIIYNTFRLKKWYTHEEIKPRLQKMIDEIGLKYTAKATDVERYFEFKSTKRNDKRVYLFTEQKFYPIAQAKHV